MLAEFCVFVNRVRWLLLPILDNMLDRTNNYLWAWHVVIVIVVIRFDVTVDRT